MPWERPFHTLEPAWEAWQTEQPFLLADLDRLVRPRCLHRSVSFGWPS